MPNTDVSLPACVLASGTVKVNGAEYVKLNVEPAGERQITFCLKRCSFAAIPGELHSCLFDYEVLEVLRDLAADGLELVVASDEPSYRLVVDRFLVA